MAICVRDADFLEVVFSEGEEYSQVDVLLLQQRQILREADLFQELCQILTRSKEVIKGQARSECMKTEENTPLAQCSTVEVQRVAAARSSLGRHCAQRCCCHGDSCSWSGGLYRLCENCSSCTGQSPGGHKCTASRTRTMSRTRAAELFFSTRVKNVYR